MALKGAIAGLNVSSERLSELISRIREIAENTRPVSFEQLLNGTHFNNVLQPRLFELANSREFTREEGLAIAFLIPRVLECIHETIESTLSDSPFNALAEMFMQAMASASNDDAEEEDVTIVQSGGLFGVVLDVNLSNND